jgi:hypothetical protein
MTTAFTVAINAIQTAHRAGLAASFPRVLAPNRETYPTNLSTASLPMILTWPSEGLWYVKGDGFGMDERTFLVMVYVAPIAQDDIPSRAVESEDLLDAIKNLWLTRANIGLVDPGDNAGGYQVTIESSFGNGHTDGGLTSGPTFAGVAYTGFVVRLRARISWTVTQ